ncbi:hypothetical protein [Paraburkholderia sp. GAS42]|uniref:hypothetical protein n=1 Tax=Paraburkholderia sp. GAS42 TaxID=3035135 RepID=UPI003D1AB3E8
MNTVFAAAPQRGAGAQAWRDTLPGLAGPYWVKVAYSPVQLVHVSYNDYVGRWQVESFGDSIALNLDPAFKEALWNGPLSGPSLPFGMQG